MKNKTIKRVLETALLVAFVVLVGNGAAMSQQVPVNSVNEVVVDPDYSVDLEHSGDATFYCQVTKTNYDLGDPNIWAAITFFNVGDGAQGCRRQIDFSENLAIPLLTELLIKGTNNSGGYFVFGPSILTAKEAKKAEASDAASENPVPQVDVERKMTEAEYLAGRVNFSVVNEYTPNYYRSIYGEAAPEALSAIRLKTTKAVLQNIYLMGNNVSVTSNSVSNPVDGIYIESDDIILRNIVVEQMAGRGLVIGPNVRNIKWEGEFNAIGGSNIGIEILGNPSVIRDIPFNGVSFKSASAYFVKSPTPAYIDWEKLMILPENGNAAKGSRVYTLTGQATSCDTSKLDISTPRDPNCTAEAAAAGQVSVVSVDAYYIDTATTSTAAIDTSATKTGNTFAKVFKLGTYPVIGSSLNGGGNFTIKISDADIKTAAKLQDASSIPDVPKIFLMANTGGLIGSSSVPFLLKSQNGGGGTPPPGGTSNLAFLSPQECSKQALMYISIDMNSPDTDGDGIYDIIEMLVKRDGTMRSTPSCDCTDSLTCWSKADTDGDGLADGSEAICKNGFYLSNKDFQRGLTGYMSDGYQVCQPDANAQNTGFRDSNDNGKPDVTELDSDGDGINDGVEDRVRIYEPSRRAFYHYVTGGDYVTLNGKKVACFDPNPSSDLYVTDIEDTLNYDQTLGIAYGMFVIDNTDPQNQTMSKFDPNSPQAQSMADSANSGKLNVVSLICKNAMLEGQENFNGRLDSTDHSDMTKADTDDDGFCDGLTVVEGKCQSTNDNCPRKKSVDNNCTLDCIPGEMKQIIADPFEKYIDAGHKTLKMNEDGIPALFDIGYGEGQLRPDDLIQICGDYDGDGIPNCVEALVANDGKYDSIGECPANPKLDPFKADSDGDGFVDGTKGGASDLCPLTAGESDDGKVGGVVSCSDNPYALYNSFPFLAYYLDRDGDGLRDGQELGGIGEIKDYNGRPNVAKGQTDPMNGDSDGDDLNDWTERQIGTDPNDKDSDDDGLDDNKEVTAGGADAASFSQERTGVSDYTCGQAIVTDPTNADSDGDGVKDGIEVNYLGTSPLNPDSDKDGLCDGLTIVGSCTGHELFTVPQVTDYRIGLLESDPCNDDTDGDALADGFEEYGCRNFDNRKGACTTNYGMTDAKAKDLIGTQTGDSDADGLPDIYEDRLQTDKTNSDSDGDNLVDGCVDGRGELCNAQRNGFRDLTATGTVYTICSAPDFLDCDTDPKLADTDGDGLNDLMERTYPSNPRVADTDGDCIPDGVEDFNKNGAWDSNETKAASTMVATPLPNGQTTELMIAAIDTDGDGLPDGRHPQLVGYEDGNCDGKVDVDANGVPTETDPRKWDSDSDGISDYDEMMEGGNGFDIANLGYALHGRKGSCSMASDGSADWGILLMFAGLLLVVGGLKRKMRNEI